MDFIVKYYQDITRGEFPEIWKLRDDYYTFLEQEDNFDLAKSEALIQGDFAEFIRGKTPEEIHQLKICVADCGDGRMLLLIYRYLSDYLINWYLEYGDEEEQLRYCFFNSYELKAKVLLHNLYAFDTKPQAIHITLLSLLLYYNEFDLKYNLFERNFGNELAKHLQQSKESDSLEMKLQDVFPEIMARGGFDIIIQNPTNMNTKKLLLTPIDFIKTTILRLKVLPQIKDKKSMILFEEVIGLVEQLSVFYPKLQTEEVPTRRTQLERRISYAKSEINKRVYELYALTEDEIKLVESS